MGTVLKATVSQPLGQPLPGKGQVPRSVTLTRVFTHCLEHGIPYSSLAKAPFVSKLHKCHRLPKDTSYFLPWKYQSLFTLTQC